MSIVRALLLLPALLLLLLGAAPTALAAGCPTQRVGYKEALAVLAANECEKLIVGGPQLSAAEAGALGALLGTNTALQELTIGNDRQDAADLFPQMGTAFLEDAGAAAIAPGLAENGGLRTVRVQCNWLGPAGGAALAAVLESNAVLEVLHVTNNEVGDAGAAAFAAALRKAGGGSALRELHLRKNQIGDAGAAALGKLLGEQRKEPHGAGDGGGGGGGSDAAPALRVLGLAGINIGDAGAAAVAAGLASNGRLVVLGLLQNEVGDAGAAALSAALRRPGSALSVLDVSRNVIGMDGVRALGELVAHPGGTALRELFATANAFTRAGNEVLADAVHRSATLTRLDVQRELYHRKDRDAMTAHLSRNARLSGATREQLLAQITELEGKLKTCRANCHNEL